MKKTVDAISDLYSAFTALNGLTSIQNSLKEKQSLLHTIEPTSSEYIKVKNEYDSLLVEQKAQQVVIATAMMNVVQSFRDTNFQDVGGAGTRIASNATIFFERANREFNSRDIKAGPHYDISLAFAIVADVAIAISSFIDGIDSLTTNKIPKAWSF